MLLLFIPFSSRQKDHSGDFSKRSCGSILIKVLDKTGFLNDPPDGYAIWDHCESWFCWPIRRLVWSCDTFPFHLLHSGRKILEKLHDKTNWERLPLTKHQGKFPRKMFCIVLIVYRKRATSYVSLSYFSNQPLKGFHIRRIHQVTVNILKSVQLYWFNYRIDNFTISFM